MSYRVAQSESYLGNDYWSWSAWIEADEVELARVDKVVWVLHPSFKQPRVTVKDRGTEFPFRIDSAGWGRFRLRAEVHVGTEMTVVSRMLSLTYPDDPDRDPLTRTGESAPLKEASEPAQPQALPASTTSAAPRVFISYASEDASQAEEVRRTIQSLGASVVDGSTVAPGVPFKAAIRKLIRESDAVVGVFGSDYVSPFVLDELTVAQVDNKPLIAIGPEKPVLPSTLAESVQRGNPDDESGKLFLSNFVASLTRD